MHVERVKVELKVSSTYWDEPPHTKIYFNNDVLHTGLLTEPKTLTWEGNLIEGEHTIKVVYRDKHILQTVLEDGVIIKDQLLNIDALSIDDINCDNLLHKLSEYTHEGTGEVQTEIVNLGKNGIWTFKFNSPVYIWLLEHLG